MNDSSIPVYVALVEVVPLDGCELEPSECGGAMVRCYVAANEDTDAMELITDALQEIRLELIDVEWCVNEAVVEWESPDNEDAAALILEARMSTTVVFSEFHTWPPE